MELVLRLAALCLVGALLAVVLKRTGPDMGLLLALAVCGAGLALLLEPLGALRDFLEEAAGWGDLPLQLFTPLVKTVGIALVSRTGSDLCRDAGESAVASVLETAGAAAAIWDSLIPAEVSEAVPPEAAQLMADVGDAPEQSLWQGLRGLWTAAQDYVAQALHQRLSGAVVLLGVVLLCSVAESFFAAAEQPSVPRYVSMAGAMAITLTAAGDFKQLMGLGVETLEELDIFAKALLPTLSAAVAASGGMVSAGAKQVATVFFTNLLLSVIRKVLLPLLYGCIVAAAADAMIPGHSLKKIGVGIRKGVTWALTGVMLLFTGFLTLTGAASSAADALTMQMTRSAISAAVPVVGSIISDATGTVLAGAGMLKSAVGVFGMLAVLAICLTPFLTIAVQYLLYKLAAFLAGTIGSGVLVELIDALGGAFGLVLGMVGSCALLLLISITSSVSVVVT